MKHFELDGFRRWLKERGMEKTSVSSNRSRIKRVSKHYDIVGEYQKDKCTELLKDFTYTKKDLDSGILPSVTLWIKGDPVKGLRSLKDAIKLFVEYLDDSEHYWTVKPPKTTAKTTTTMSDDGCVSDFDRCSCILGHFNAPDDRIPPKSICNILCHLESHYECIMGFARELFGLHEIERIPVFLSPETIPITYTMDDKQLSEMIANYARDHHGNVSEQDILRIMRNKTIKHHIAGKFCHGDGEHPYIVLYYRVIGGKTAEEKIAKFANVLAHEYMHYMEYVYCLRKEPKHNNKFVSEAMADFFGEIYSIRCNSTESLEVARARYELWKERFYTYWPYAKALHFYFVGGFEMAHSDKYADYETHGCIKKLIEVFECCDKPDLAYGILTR